MSIVPDFARMIGCTEVPCCRAVMEEIFAKSVGLGL